MISIIIPIYKVELYLRKCVDSILAQTYTNLEIILVDDGSPDGCGAICDEYAEKDKRVKVIHKPNGGLSDARNVGIEAATGEYIAFVDSDDYIHPQMYEKLYNALVDAKADISICNFEYVYLYDKADKNENNNLPIKDEVLTGRDILTQKMTGQKIWYWVVAWNKLYRAELFKNIRYPKGKIHEDEFVIHYVYGMSDKVACVSDMLYEYVQREDSIMHAEFDIRRLDRVEALFDRCLNFMENGIGDIAVYRTLIRAIGGIHNGYKYYSNRKLKKIEQYKKVCKELRIVINKVIKLDLPLKSKCRLAIEWASPYLAWQLGKLR